MPLADGAYDRAMRPLTSPAYWPTRILLAVGFAATGLVLALDVAMLLVPEPMFDPRPAIIGLSAHVVGGLLGPIPALIGLVWMIRIFRGPRDEPPPWRYRDR
jgi:hypothetical protein